MFWILPRACPSGMLFAILYVTSSMVLQSACLASEHTEYSLATRPRISGPKITPVVITRTMSETPSNLDTFDAVHVAPRKPAMQSIAM